MSTELIIYPALAMFALTMGNILYLGLCRYRAIHKGEVRISFFRGYNEGSQPERLHILGRHVQNHFEVPPLFYVGVILAYITQSVGTPTLIFAWLFVASRCMHTCIHLGNNNVSHRFFTYGFGLFMLIGLWGSILVSMA